MQSEVLDIYDENNKPLGVTKSRVDVHQNGYWHRTVHIYLIDQAGNYLVHLRSPDKDDHPNCWDTHFGGHVVAGKDYLQTALEELGQEIGLIAQVSDLLKGEVYKYDGAKNKEFMQTYYYRFAGDVSMLKFNDGEVVEVKWMNAKEIISSADVRPELWAGGIENFQTVDALYRSIYGEAEHQE